MLVYFYGGGFVAGDGSEPRYDGESMARKGIVAVTVNYRLGVFGFLAHPELTKESPHHASGNYGLLDQNAALRWVQQNIAAFGGDPGEGHDRRRVGRVDLGQRADGVAAVEGPDRRRDRRERRADRADAAARPARRGRGGRRRSSPTTSGAKSLADAARDAGRAAARGHRRSPAAGRFPLAIDGYFLPEDSRGDLRRRRAGARAAAGRLELRGDELPRPSWAQDEPTPRELTRRRVQRLYGDRADEVLKAVRGGHRRGGRAGGHRPGERPVHRLQHLEVGRPARQDRRQAGLPLLLRAPAAGDAPGDGQRGPRARRRRA